MGSSNFRELLKQTCGLGLGAALILAVTARTSQAEFHTSGDRSGKMKQRLEQLFVWRVSDRLSLSPKQEQEFAAEFRKISEERSKLSAQIEDLLDQLDKEKENQARRLKILADYETAVKKYSSSQLNEMTAMKRIFDSSKFIEYVLLKREMHQKFKDVLTQNATGISKVEKTTLKEPEVIQEK